MGPGYSGKNTGSGWFYRAIIITFIPCPHLLDGWLAIAEGAGFFATERTMEAIDRMEHAKDILKEHGDYSWLTENGPIVILNNGIEFAATYFIMLLALLVIGAGKFASLDYWIARKFRT